MSKNIRICRNDDVNLLKVVVEERQGGPRAAKVLNILQPRCFQQNDPIPRAQNGLFTYIGRTRYSTWTASDGHSLSAVFLIVACCLQGEHVKIPTANTSRDSKAAASEKIPVHNYRIRANLVKREPFLSC
jgi:hypothetical protein